MLKGKQIKLYAATPWQPYAKRGLMIVNEHSGSDI